MLRLLTGQGGRWIMNNGPLLFLGILASVAGSFWALLLAPHLQLGSQQPVVLESTGRSEERRVGKECRSRWSPYH